MAEPQPYRPRCIYLTCKSMQVFGENFESDPEFQNGMTEFSCTETFRNTGPDNADVNYDACRDPERPCFREF